MIYLDHAATTPPDGAVVEAMARCMRENWRNPSSPYADAGPARRALREARAALAELLNADPWSVVFTSGGSEANNQAVSLAQGGHAVISAIEHASVLKAASALCREVTLVPPDASGVVSPEAVERALRLDTRLISVMFANNETGVVQPVFEIGALARARHIPFHCDAVQAVGHVPIDLSRLNIDLLTLSAHKFYGPRGAGALIARPSAPVSTLIHGGGQEFGLRAGTENVPAICGLGVAAKLAQAGLADEAARERALMADFLRDVRRRIPALRILGRSSDRLPGVAALLLPGISSETAIARLDLMGVQVSGGAACATAERAPSHVYRAMGLTDTEASQVIRISIGKSTTPSDLLQAGVAMEEALGDKRQQATGNRQQGNGG